MKPTRSYLFVPGNRPERIERAFQCGSDAVIVDLEDAIPTAEKSAARRSVQEWLSADRPVVLRINAFGTAEFSADLALCLHPGVMAVMLPKSELAAHIERVAAETKKAVIPLIETARGLCSIIDIAKAQGVQRLAFGSIDLQADLRMRDIREEELLPIRLQFILASRIADIAAPIDSPSLTLNDEKAVVSEATRSRRLGFSGKLCIHPRQVPLVNAAMSPGEVEVSWAKQVLSAASAANGGVTAVLGQMVDKPVIDRARSILAEAGGTAD